VHIKATRTPKSVITYIDVTYEVGDPIARGGRIKTQRSRLLVCRYRFRVGRTDRLKCSRLVTAVRPDGRPMDYRQALPIAFYPYLRSAKARYRGSWSVANVRVDLTGRCEGLSWSPESALVMVYVKSILVGLAGAMVAAIL
jgi:hypothetical protein